MFHLVVKYCIRDRKILGYTLFGIVVSVALMYNLLLTADSISQTFIAMASEGQKYDMAFVDIGEDQQKKVEQYVAQNSCKGYLSGDFLGDIYLEDALLPTTVMGYRGDLEYIMDASLVEGSLPDSDGEICLDVSENAGLKKPYQIGDWITVKVTEDGNEEEYILKCQVSGFVDGIPLEGNYALISLEWCDRLKKSWNLSGNSFRFTQVCCKESYDEEKELSELFDDLGLNSLLNQYPNELSGGQQQKVAIARALVNKPQIILADEPTGNLDSHSTSEVMELLKRCVKKYKQTLIMVTHNMKCADMADRVIFLQDGRIM